MIAWFITHEAETTTGVKITISLWTKTHEAAAAYAALVGGAEVHELEADPETEALLADFDEAAWLQRMQS